MSPKTEERQPGVAAVRITARIPIKNILVEKQHRTFFDEKKLKEMAGSMAKFDILQPLLVRVRPGETIDDTTDLNKLQVRLVAGERRLRAAKMAGLQDVPVEIHTWNDQEAAEAQALENIQRADLTPIEEARAFDKLLKAGGYTVESLAQRVDKSEAYVYRAIALLDLPAEVLKQIETGKLTPAHGHQLLRCPPEDRETIYKEWLDDWDAKDKGFTALSLRDVVESHSNKDLDRACFPKNKPYAGEMACTACPFNSGNQGNLFDGAEKGKCLKASCFNLKTEAAREEVAGKAAKAHPGIPMGGIVDREYNGLPKVKGIVIQEKTAGTKKLKALMEESPHKFSLVVAKESNWGDKKAPEAFLVCKDRELLEKAGVLKPEPKAPEVSRQSPEDAFIEKAVDAAVLKLAAESVGKVGEKTILMRIIESFLDMLYDNSDKEAFRAIGKEVPEAKKEWDALTVPQLLAVAWILAHDAGTSEMEAALKKAGADVAKVKKLAKKEAKARWATHNATGAKTKGEADAEDGAGEDEEE